MGAEIEEEGPPTTGGGRALQVASGPAGPASECWSAQKHCQIIIPVAFLLMFVSVHPQTTLPTYLPSREGCEINRFSGMLLSLPLCQLSTFLSHSGSKSPITSAPPFISRNRGGGHPSPGERQPGRYGRGTFHALNFSPSPSHAPCRKNPQNGNIYLSTSNTCSTILPHPHPSHFPPSPVPQYKSRPSRTKLNFLSPQTFVEPLSPGRSTARHRHTPTPRGDPS